MQANIIEISSDNRELSIRRGFLVIAEHGGTVIAETPLDSICAVMTTGRAVVYTQPLLSALCENGIPLIVIGENYNPIGILTPLIGNYKQMAVQSTQINASKPLIKQLWQSLVRQKIKNQSRTLDLFGCNNRLHGIIGSVASGDSGNAEATAARLYFPALFGKDFRRWRMSGGANALMNYGYAVLRGAMARQLAAAGLNLSLGIHHCNQLNPMCLCDDLIELFRPAVDCEVYRIISENPNAEPNPETKRRLAAILEADSGGGPVIQIMQNLVWSLTRSFEQKKNLLEFSNVLPN